MEEIVYIPSGNVNYRAVDISLRQLRRQCAVEGKALVIHLDWEHLNNRGKDELVELGIDSLDFTHFKTCEWFVQAHRVIFNWRPRQKVLKDKGGDI